MEVQIPGRNIKLFSKALAAIAKIGPDMLLEVTNAGLNVQTLNQARSAFVLFRFNTTFFFSFRRTVDASDPPTRVQIQVKPCLAVFRAISSVDHCDVTLDVETNCVLFAMHCKMGVQKKHRINVEDSNANRAVYSKITPNRLVARARTLLDCVEKNFHTGIEEITLVARANHLTLKSYQEVDEGLGGVAGARGAAARKAGGGAGTSVLKTELVVDSQDFEEYTVKPNAEEVTFALKELRAILKFAEAAGQPLSLYFSGPGHPVLLSIACYDALVVDFVLATMNVTVSAAIANGSSQSSAAAPTSASAMTGLSGMPTPSAQQQSYSKGSSPPAAPRRSRNTPQRQQREDFEDDEDEDDEHDNDPAPDGGEVAAGEEDENDFIEGTPERESKRARV